MLAILRGMRKPLLLGSIIAVALLTAAAVALATAPKANLIYAGRTAHNHYYVNIETRCSGTKCTSASTVAVSVTAGSAGSQSSSCPYSGYEMPVGKLKNGKFSVSTRFLTQSGGTLKFSASGTFTSGGTKVQGSVTGIRACGGTDTFTLKAAKPTSVHTITGPTAQ